MTSYENLRYSDVRARASHNSYQRDEDLCDQLLYWRLRSIELDIHVDSSLRNDWRVYHNLPHAERPNVRTLTDGLKLLAGFHSAVPEHEVITLAIDLKNDFDKTHTPDLLDSLLVEYLDLWTPADLVKNVSKPANLQAGAYLWPRLKDLRGKVIVIFTTGDLDSETSHLNQYFDRGKKALTRKGFVAPEISSTAKISDARYENAVFFNMKVSDSKKVGPTVFNSGLISRGYGGNNESDFRKGVKGKNHIIGTDNVNSLVDTWSRTDNQFGWPFEGILITADSGIREAGAILNITVKSGDIFDKKDSCVFVPVETIGSADRTFVYAVGVPSSHVPDKNGKAGLMVRSSFDANAANFAILRVADNNEVRVQVRKKNGADTDQYKLDVSKTTLPNVSGDSWLFVRLDVTNGGKTIEGFTSYDHVNSEWVSLHKETFDNPIVNVGLVASSHATGKEIRYLFVPIQPNAAVPKLELRSIGEATGSASAGVYPGSG